MEITRAIIDGLGVALNEATLLGVELLPETRVVGVTLSLLTLPEAGPPPQDTRVQFRLAPVGRVAASLRLGRWDDPAAKVVKFRAEELLATVRGLGSLPIYGWEFIDVHKKYFPAWSNRLSLDWRSGADGVAHTLFLFQEGSGRHLDLCIWFDQFDVVRPTDEVVPILEVIEGGRRWWDAFHAGDPRTAGCGMFPLQKQRRRDV